MKIATRPVQSRVTARPFDRANISRPSTLHLCASLAQHGVRPVPVSRGAAQGDGEEAHSGMGVSVDGSNESAMSRQASPVSASALGDKVPPTVNWHLTPHCNYKCRFCFATFDDTDKRLALIQQTDMQEVLKLLKQKGFQRITFVGGEPLLHPHIYNLIQEAKRAGLRTCLVTNGSLLTEKRLKEMQHSLDILAFSVDSSTAALNAQLGRGLQHEILPIDRKTGQVDSSASVLPGNKHIARVQRLCDLAHELGMTLKINTVVTSVNAEDDMTQTILQMNPKRWKIFQALPVEGQNTGLIEPLLVDTEAFNRYVQRHKAALSGSGIEVVSEDNEAMRGSYAMLDHMARFFTSNTMEPQAGSTCTPGYLYGPSILEVGVHQAWAAVAPHFEADTFLERGGVWEYGTEETLASELAQAEKAAKLFST